MHHWVGFDVGKAFHWVCVLDGEGDVVLSKRVEASEERIEEALSEIARMGGPEERVVGIDIVGGPATLLEALLLARGERVRYIPGTAVNRARDAYPSGERKSDPGDAFVIADQLRLRWRSLSAVRAKSEDLEEVRLLVGHRRDLVQEQVRRTTRLRGLLAEVFPGMEASLDLRKQGPLLAATKVATPTAARRLGKSRLARWLKAKGALKADSLAERIVEAAKLQRQETPAAGAKAAIVAEIATEVLRTKRRLDEIDARLEELVGSDPRGALVRSLPGMGLVLTAEFLAEVGDVGRFGSADRLAAAAGIVPVLRSSGSVSYQRRAKKGNRALKRIFYRSAFCALSCEGRSRDYYLRKRAEGKGAQQAIIALARRRVNVLWAMLRDGKMYENPPPKGA
jgi:transposase